MDWDLQCMNRSINQQTTVCATWHTLMKMKYDVVPDFILSAWMLTRAALTGREANGGTLWRYHLCLQPISLNAQ
jgi:hypothetical protein